MSDNNKLTEAQEKFILEVEIAMREVDSLNISMYDGYHRLIKLFQLHLDNTSKS